MNTRLDFLPIAKDLTSASCATNSSNFGLRVKEKSSLSNTDFQDLFDTKREPYEFRTITVPFISSNEDGIFPAGYIAWKNNFL
jgi:hypothetical protein